MKTPPHKFNFGPNKITQIDLKPLELVDIVVDAEEMSQHLTQQYDYLANCSMLEHTPHPWKVIEQINALLRPGGIVYISIPWLYLVTLSIRSGRAVLPSPQSDIL
ncbi:class I SAM-dependent methyltransferase [Cylindrospermopsis curvispora]|uniref:Methyltransferase domain-containing protein n=1 Tax=Cylindrospermopsis curvispora GIHE-G1 TaxID=2666332 RepID=A0A7H0F1J3_9CYAN|nr:methyltransferase domain-containing protein [Cylindrospermopsis curvispora]QNP29909.1 methyltransferase domain-containing protein [Cylindrospermopsis curvispora GIHE-G1]